ncbi:hypothetical protein SLA2020_261740 [Shorea laevis]
MTETVVTLVINELVQLIVHESKLLKGVHQEVVDIRDELESIQCFLKDADKEDLKDGVKAYQDSRYQNIVREIKERSERYGFSSLEQGSSSSATNDTWHDPRVGSLFIEEDEVVGIESTRDELVSWLVGGASKRSVISVVGMGGIGKTTLAKKVYENESVKGHFDYRVWITVSQSFNEQKIFMSMKNQIYQAKETAPGELDMMDEITLISQLREYLQQKRYVVVFDDVWKTEFWEIVKHALPCNGRGSRIIITTRSDLIGVSCKESLSDQIHKLQPLSQDKAWELFCRKAFQSEFQGCCPKELARLSMDIVRKCEGLPLAIVAIGGLLSTKEKVPLEWQKLHDSLSSELECNPQLTKDYSIASERLLWQWVAEGFIKGKKGKSLEDVAQEYLMELVNRNLVQVSFGELDYEMSRKYKIHDLLHDIILSKAGELNFCQVWKQSLSMIEANHHGVGLFEELRKLSQLRIFAISNVTTERGRALCTSIQNMVHLRILIVGSSSEDGIIDLQSISSPPPLLEHALPNLTTLSLYDAYDGEQLHFEEGGFRKLKRLTLRKLKKLKMVEIDRGSLPGLEILEIGQCPQMKELPSGIQHLKSLKILDFYEMLGEFVLRMQPDGGEDYWKVKKVSTIRLKYRIKGERYQIYKLGDSDLLERLQGLES